MNVKVTTRDS